MDSIFSKIINKEISSDIRYEDELCIAIDDINPKSRVHILVIPKKPIINISTSSDADKDLLESFASEQGARMMAMENATENAKEMIDELKLEFNKARQTAITTEMLEIVGGAEALTN